MPALRPPPIKPAAETIGERIQKLRADIAAIVDDLLAIERAECGGMVPIEMLRRSFEIRYGTCHCNVWQRLQAEKAGVKGREQEQERLARELAAELAEGAR